MSHTNARHVTRATWMFAALSALLMLCVTPRVQAQGTRKDDIVLNARGLPVGGAVVRVCAAGATGQPCTPLANVYSDLALTHPLANPLATDGLGNYTFYAAPGLYEIEISGTGIGTRQFPNVLLPGTSSDALGPGAFNVVNYGAVDDNVTDSSPAFQAAVNACEASTVLPGYVFVPVGAAPGIGSYVLHEPLVLTTATPCFRMIVQGNINTDHTLVFPPNWSITGTALPYGSNVAFPMISSDTGASPIIQIGDGTDYLEDIIIENLEISADGIGISVVSAIAATGFPNNDIQLNNVNIETSGTGNTPAVKVRDTNGFTVNGGQYGGEFYTSSSAAFDLGGTNIAGGGTTNVNINYINMFRGNGGIIKVSSDGPLSGPNGQFTLTGINATGYARDFTTYLGPAITIDTTNANFIGLNCLNSYNYTQGVDTTPFLAWSAGTTGQLTNVSLNNCFSSGHPISNSPNRVVGPYTTVPAGQAIQGLKIITQDGSVYSPNLLTSSAAPTISSGFGAGASVTHNNGTASFTINVGTGGTASSGIVGLPAASNGWYCTATDLTTQSTSVAATVQTASSVTSATLTQYNNVKVATAWSANDVLAVSCLGY